jgi:uncharacterized protein (TIGR02246 family)
LCSWKRGITAIRTLAALFDTDADFVNVTGLWWHTRDEIRSAHAYGLTRIFKDSRLQATDTRVKRLSDEISVVHARMALTGQTPVDEITSPRPRSNVVYVHDSLPRVVSTTGLLESRIPAGR